MDVTQTPDALVGPDTITIRCSASGGPFGATDRRLTIAGERFSVVNAGEAALVLERSSVDPVRDASTGLAAAGALAVSTGATSLSPAEAAGFVLAGEVPGRPGRYATTARIIGAEGSALACPVAIEISAHAAWGIAAMLLGLLAIGLLNLLAGTSDRESTLGRALAARQDIAATLERTPPPASLAGDVATMNDDFARAIARLRQGWPATLTGRPQADAGALLDEAGRIAARLRAVVDDRRAGAAEVEDLEKSWQYLQPVVQQMAAPAAPAPTGTFAGQVQTFIAARRELLVRGPAMLLAAEVAGQLARMKLAVAAGHGEAARGLALNTRSWLERSAAALEQGAALQEQVTRNAMIMLANDRSLRDRLPADDIDPGSRVEIAAELDAAEARLANHPTDGDMQDADHLINQAAVARLRAVGDAIRARIAGDTRTIDQDTDIGDIQALLDRLNAEPLPHTLAMKQAGIGQVIALWRAHLARLPDPAATAAMGRTLDAMQKLVDQGRMAELGRAMAGFFEDSPKEFARLVNAAVDRRNHPRCVEYGDDLDLRLSEIEWTLRTAAATPQVAAWDLRRDRLRYDLQQVRSDPVAIGHDCLTPLIRVDGRVINLENEILASGVRNSTLPSATRLRLLASIPNIAVSGIAAEDGPRHLTVLVTTPPGDRVANRDLSFQLSGDDPAWGHATVVRVDFGDGTEALSEDGETLRRHDPILHRYGRALSAHVAIRATETDADAGATNLVVGLGSADIVVQRSPVTGAQALAAEFLNLRFGLALAIASVMYFWRYHARDAVFGARAYDYVEAFALGFAVQAAVAALPAALAGFVG